MTHNPRPGKLYHEIVRSIFQYDIICQVDTHVGINNHLISHLLENRMKTRNFRVYVHA